MWLQLHVLFLTESSGAPAAWEQLLRLDQDSILSVLDRFVNP
jgi:hypothetical protein